MNRFLLPKIALVASSFVKRRRPKQAYTLVQALWSLDIEASVNRALEKA